MSLVNAAPPPAAKRPDADLWQRYAEYLRRPPLLSIEWADRETSARGWLVINSLRGGAAGGGTRMRAGLGHREVVYLAKAMELKFCFSGPPIGGAKSGIRFDPADPRRADVLRRWFRAIAPQLRHCYGTGGDLNVDELLDVVPACREVGLLHPQEGVVRGHLRPAPDRLPHVFASLDEGVQTAVEGGFGVPGVALPVAGLITGYGLARSIAHTLERQGRSLRGARVLIEGFGAVGGPCALYLAREGAAVVGITDHARALLAPDGLDADEVEALLRGREDKCLPRDDARCLPGAEGLERFGALPADVFVAAACSETLDESRLERLEQQGVRTIACGANQPFREAELGHTHVARHADARFSVIPDVVANCGRARAFSYFMEHTDAPAAAAFEAVDRTIGDAVEEVHARAAGRAVGGATGLLAATLEFALDNLGER